MEINIRVGKGGACKPPGGKKTKNRLVFFKVKKKQSKKVRKERRRLKEGFGEHCEAALGSCSWWEKKAKRSGNGNRNGVFGGEKKNRGRTRKGKKF